MKKLKLSASAIKTYEKCPRQYYYNYIKKPNIEKKERSYLELGNFVHDTLDKFHRALLADPTHKWNSLMSEVAKMSLPSFKLDSENKKIAKNMLKEYLRKLEVDGLPSVVASEQGFSFDVFEDVLIRGYIDRIDMCKDDDSNEHYTIVDYKGLALDTPIPTTSGWSTMGQLRVGDMVIGSDGKPTRVIIKSRTYNRPCYRITFNDATSVVSDNVHLWSVTKVQHGQKDITKVLSTDELADDFSKKHGKFVIKNPKGIEYGRGVPLDDPWELGFGVAEGAGKILRDDHLLGPIKYRIELVKGFMDSSGSINTNTSRCEFKYRNIVVRDKFLELVRGLGVFAKVDKASGTVVFSTNEFVPFRDSKKSAAFNIIKNRFTKEEEKDFTRKEIVCISKVSSVPTQCISVDAKDSLYVCGDGMTMCHNTGKSKYLDEFQLTLYGLYLLRKVPDLERFKGTYLMLAENCKELSYNFNLTQIEEVKSYIRKVADQIQEEKTWEPKVQFLCNYCDFKEVCPAMIKKQSTFGKVEWESE